MQILIRAHLQSRKAKYDTAAADLKRLMEKKDAILKEELMEAIVSSDKSHYEIPKFLNGVGHSANE
jgi:hypothetical protein